MSGTNPVGTWALTIWTGAGAQTASQYKSNIDANFSVLQRVGDCFAPKPNSPAAMSVVVDAGFIVSTSPTGMQVCTEVGNQLLTISTAPSTPLNRIDLIVVDSTTGAASVIAGSAATSPVAPSISAGKMQICQVSVPNGTVAIGNSNITDLRAVWGGGGGSGGGIQWGISTNSGDHFSVSYSPAIASYTDGLIVAVRFSAANTTTTPDLNVNSLGARTITKQGGSPLVANDIPGNLSEGFLRYNSSNARFELMNPAVPSGFTTGDVKPTFKTTADTSWVMMNDGTIGDASSGATTRANSDVANLYSLLWNNISDTYCPVSTGRGASASADFAAHKTITLPKMLGRALSGAGAGAGLTSRSLGQTLGEETHILTAAEEASLPVSGTTSVTVTTTVNTYADPGSIGGADAVQHGDNNTFVAGIPFSGTGTGTVSGTATGGGGAHNNMQPTIFLNYMIKL